MAILAEATMKMIKLLLKGKGRIGLVGKVGIDTAESAAAACSGAPRIISSANKVRYRDKYRVPKTEEAKIKQ